MLCTDQAVSSIRGPGGGKPEYALFPGEFQDYDVYIAHIRLTRVIFVKVSVSVRNPLQPIIQAVPTATKKAVRYQRSS